MTDRDTKKTTYEATPGYIASLEKAFNNRLSPEDIPVSNYTTTMIQNLRFITDFKKENGVYKFIQKDGNHTLYRMSTSQGTKVMIDSEYSELATAILMYLKEITQTDFLCSYVTDAIGALSRSGMNRLIDADIKFMKYRSLVFAYNSDYIYKPKTALDTCVGLLNMPLEASCLINAMGNKMPIHRFVQGLGLQSDEIIGYDINANVPTARKAAPLDNTLRLVLQPPKDTIRTLDFGMNVDVDTKSDATLNDPKPQRASKIVSVVDDDDDSQNQNSHNYL